MNVASLKLCKKLYTDTGWEYTEDHRCIEKVWIESFSTSEMGMGNDDYETTPLEERRQYHVGEYGVRDNPKNFIGVPESVPWGWANRYYEETIKRSVPAYDLDYILSKLPKTAKHPVTGEDHTIGISWHITKKKWIADYERSMLPHAQADNPTDAVAKLAVELLKSGVLANKPLASKKAST